MKHLTDAIIEIIVGSSPSFLLTQQCIHHAGQTDTEMFVVYFESFLFIHIYIFTKTLIQQASNRNKQSELQKGEFLKQTHIHNRNNAPHFHIMQNLNTHLYPHTHTHTHTHNHAQNANTLNWNHAQPKTSH